MTTTALVDHFFRHEYGRLVAMLTCRIGVEHIEDIEDAVQSALMTALEGWTMGEVPDNPSAWLYRVAYNELRGGLRQQSRRRRLLRESLAHESDAEDPSEFFSFEEVQDDLLRMLFVYCNDAMPLESQLVLSLKTLCGFDVREIAIRLFASEANVYKRLSRARDRLRELAPQAEELTNECLASRLPAVHKVLYLLFTEGYLSSRSDIAIRRELCDEAIRLATLLAEHSAEKSPETYALLALMHLHKTRITAREDGSGGLLLLEEQNREEWDSECIQEGLRWLAMSAEGDTFSRYHAEASIAAEHCLAPNLVDTRWDRICASYEMLEQSTLSPIHKLNHAVAIAEWKGPAHGLELVNQIEPPPWLSESYLWAAVHADLNRRCGNDDEAARYRELAINSAPSPHVSRLLRRRLGAPA